MRVVLEGEADAAEHLDAVLGDGHGAIEGDGRSDVGGIVRLVDRKVCSQGGSDVPGHGGHRLGGLQHPGAQVLDRLERADGGAELLAHLGMVHRGVEAPLRQAGRFGRCERDEDAAYSIAIHARQLHHLVGARAHADPPSAPGQIDAERRLGAPAVSTDQHPGSVVRGREEPPGTDDVEHDVEVTASTGIVEGDRSLQRHRRAVTAGDAGKHICLRDQMANERRAQHGSGDQVVRCGFHRHHLVEQVTAAAGVLLVDPDAGQAHLDDGLPGLRERRGGIGLGLAHRRRAAQAGGPGTQGRAQLEMIARHPDRHERASKSRTCFNNHSDARRG